MGLGHWCRHRPAFQDALVLAAVDSEGCGGDLGKGFRSGVFIDEAILHDRLQAIVELAGEGLVVPFYEPPDAIEVGEVGGDGGGLSEGSELLFFGPGEIWVSEGVLQGLGEVLEGLEFGWGSFRGIAGHGSRVLVQEGLEPIVCGSVEVSGSKENLLGFGREEFGAAEVVVATLGEKDVKLVLVP